MKVMQFAFDGSEARMNTPGTERGNWNWRMAPDDLEHPGWKWLREATVTNDRRSRSGDDSEPVARKP